MSALEASVYFSQRVLLFQTLFLHPGIVLEIAIRRQLSISIDFKGKNHNISSPVLHGMIGPIEDPDQSSVREHRDITVRKSTV